VKQHSRVLLLALSATCLHAPFAQRLAPRCPSVQERLFDALARVENCAALRNPGCLKFAGQLGARRGPGGYAVFWRLVDGERALRRQIVRGQGRTVVEFLKRYNPVGSGYPEKVAAFGRLGLEEVL
jgi:hypothetical protein